MDRTQRLDAYFLFTLGKAWYEENGKLYLVSLKGGKPEPCRAGDIKLLLDVSSRMPEIISLKKDEIYTKLQEGYNSNTVLSFVLDGFDSSLKSLTRESVIKRANQLLTETPAFEQFVRGGLRSLIQPLPREFDISTAIQIAHQVNATLIEQLYVEFEQHLHIKKVFIEAPEEASRHKNIFRQTAEDTLYRMYTQLSELQFIEPPQENIPSKEFAQREQILIECDIAAVFYYETPASWLTQRLNLYRVIQAKRKNSLIIYIFSQQTQPSSLKIPPNTEWISGNIPNYLVG